MNEANRISGSSIINCCMFVVLILCGLITHGMTENNKAGNILVLHSYHPTFRWNIEINEGIHEVFSRSPRLLNIAMEYMDSKRLFDEQYQHYLYQLYAYKYGNVAFDVILISDDDALTFLAHHGKELFPGVPVVFCGINNYHPSLRDTLPHFTGVLEELDKVSTVSLALELFPQTQTVYFLGDHSTTAHDLSRIFHSQHERKFPGYQFKYLHSADLELVKDSVARIESNTVILMWPYLNQDMGRLVENEKALNQIAQVAKVPLFGFWHFMLGEGIVGGKLVSGKTQGIEAASVTLKILEGTDASAVEVQEFLPNDFYFDYLQLKKFQVSMEELPPDSNIINLPQTFYQRHQAFFTGFFIAIGAMSLLLLILLIISRKTRKILKDESKFQQELINALPNAVFYTFGDRIEGFNKAFKKLTGLSQDVISNMELKQLYLPSQAEKHLSINTEILKTKKPVILEGSIAGHNDELRDVIFYKSVIYNQRTRKYGIIETIIDITDKKLSGERIRKSDERYTLVTLATKDGVWDWNLKEKDLFVSGRLKEILGYNADENPINHNNMIKTIHPEDQNIFNHQIDLLQQDLKDSYILELRLKKKDGSYIWIESKAFALKDQHKNVYRIVGTISDIQNRKDNEARLRKWEEIFRNTQMGIAVLSGASGEVIESMNPVFARINGYTIAELTGKQLAELILEDEQQKLKEMMEKVASEGHLVWQAIMVKKDQATYPAMLDISTVKNKAGAVDYFILNLQDLSDKKEES